MEAAPSPPPESPAPPINIQAQALPTTVRAALARANLAPSSMAASVQALPNMVWPKEGQKGALMAAAAPIPRLAWQAGKAMNPASVMKTVTTAVALQSLGADFQWQTTVWIDGALRDGTLYGNLIVQGGGDPYLPTAVLQELVDAIRSKGVQRIAGDFLVNQSLWHLPAFDPAAFDNKPERPYNASPQALMANMQALEVQLQVAGSEAAIKTEPPIVGIALPASVALSNSPCVQPEKILAPDFGVAGQISFKGSWPRSCGTRSVFYALPALQGDFAAQTLAGLWLASGGGLTGQARLEGRGHKGARRLLRFASRPLQEAATVTNTYSNNPMAKQIFLSLPVFGKLPRHLRRPTGSYSASQRWLADWWRLHLPQVAAPVLENGAGLSRRERISPGSLNALLAQTAASTVGAEFVQSLPLAGSQGTVARLAQRDPGNRAIGQARLKTGTLDDAKAIAGFVRGQSGQVYSVVAIINDGRAPAGQAAIDALLDWVAAESQ